MAKSAQAPTATFEDLPDEALMRAIGGGDEGALRELIHRWQTPLINFFYRSQRDLAGAEDLAQVVFLRLYRAAPRYQPTARFSTYVFHIARRLLINERQKQERRPSLPTDPADLRAVDPGTSAHALQELEEIFQLTLHSLPENQRTAILLLKQQQLSYEEIAAIMDASESAVKTWIFRARQSLKQALKEQV